MNIIQSQLLIHHMSSLEGTNYLLYGYTMDHYTNSVVHSMSNNNGFSMSYYFTTNQLYSVPNTNIKVGSPLSTTTSREIAIFCHYMNIPYKTLPLIINCKGDSVYRLALDMVAKLQDDCDSTLHIVTETCGKLQQCPDIVKEQAHLCKLCKE